MKLNSCSTVCAVAWENSFNSNKIDSQRCLFTLEFSRFLSPHRFPQIQGILICCFKPPWKDCSLPMLTAQRAHLYSWSWTRGKEELDFPYHFIFLPSLSKKYHASWTLQASSFRRTSPMCIAEKIVFCLMYLFSKSLAYLRRLSKDCRASSYVAISLFSNNRQISPKFQPQSYSTYGIAPACCSDLGTSASLLSHLFSLSLLPLACTFCKWSPPNCSIKGNMARPYLCVLLWFFGSFTFEVRKNTFINRLLSSRNTVSGMCFTHLVVTFLTVIRDSVFVDLHTELLLGFHNYVAPW